MRFHCCVTLRACLSLFGEMVGLAKPPFLESSVEGFTLQLCYVTTVCTCLLSADMAGPMKLKLFERVLRYDFVAALWLFPHGCSRQTAELQLSGGSCFMFSFRGCCALFPHLCSAQLAQHTLYPRWYQTGLNGYIT